MHFSRSLALGFAAVGVASGLGASRPAAAQTLSTGDTAQILGASSPQPSAFALSQIAALQAEKAARTPTQNKIDSNLLRAALLARPTPQRTRPLPGALSTSTLSLLRTIPVARAAQPDANGMVLVDIKGTVSSDLLAQVEAAGGVVKGAWPKFGAIRALMPVIQLETVAGNPAVLSVRPASQAHVVRSQVTPLTNPLVSGLLVPSQESPRPLVPGRPQVSPPAALTAAARRARVQAALPALLARVRAAQAHAQTSTVKAGLSLAALGGGVVNTADPEGDSAQRATLARQTFRVTGAGIRIGVISDSVDGLAQEQRIGRLGPVTVLAGQDGVPGTGEGTAMLEIVHRLAPGAQLFFATAFNGEASFAANILALQQAGCNVIVDDVSYFDEPPFQDGIIAQAVDTASAAGAYYFSSAGNNYNVDQEGFSANWEGNFRSASNITINGVSYPTLAFNTANTNTDQVLTVPGYAQQDIFLFWANPASTAASGATDDYDLYVLNSAATQIVFSSTDPHTGQPGQDPIQACEADQGDRILVTKNHGNSVDLHLFLTSDGAAVLRIATPGGTYGHATANSCYGTAAADASIPYAAHRTFLSTDVTEAFSSDGPRRIIFNPDGSEITPGNRTATGGVVRQKPVLTASDGVTTFFAPFYGTSAAAPHAAAIAGLVLSADPNLQNEPTQMFSLLTTSCIPFDTAYGAVPNRDAGYGLLDAYAAVQQSVALFQAGM